MRLYTTQPPSRFNNNNSTKASSVRSDPSAAEASSASATATTATAKSSLPSSSTTSFAWPSGNSYDKGISYKKPSASSSKQKEFVPPRKALFPRSKNQQQHQEEEEKEEKATGALNPPAPATSSLPSTPAIYTSTNAAKKDDEVSAATSVTAMALREAAKHCIRGQELASVVPTSSVSPLHASIKEYQSALYILEQTIGSGFADRRECRALLVMSQIFYWMGLAFRELASVSRKSGKVAADSHKDAPEEAATEYHERNAIQAFVSCLRLRYHLLDRGEEEKDDSYDDDETNRLLKNFVAPVMDIQLDLTNLWESSNAPFCNMTAMESARKLRCLRIATWNEDKGDDFMFAIAEGTSAKNNNDGGNVDKALAHYRKAMETFSDENHKSDILRLKIASCYRQSGLRKLNNHQMDDATMDFEAAVFWYRSALKSFCATVRFVSTTPSTTTATATAHTSSQPQSQSPTPSVSSIDMSDTDSIENDGIHTTKHKPIMTKHPTYQRILLRIEEILSWTLHQHQAQRQREKRQGGVSGTETATIAQETAMKDYLRSKMKESLSHQNRAEAMLSPTAAWRRKPSKQLLSLPKAGVTLSDEAASTMSSMSVLANALVMMRACLRIEAGIWGASHPIVRNIQERIDVAEAEYSETEEQHAGAVQTTQRVQNTTKLSKQYDNFHRHVEDLVEENKRLRTALDDSTNEGLTSQNSRSMYQQKSGEPSRDKAAAAAAPIVPLSPLSYDNEGLNRPVEFVNIVSSQTTNNGNSKLPFETRGYVATKPRSPSKFLSPPLVGASQQYNLFPENLFAENSTSTNSEHSSSKKGDDRFESMVHVMNHCKNLEDELKEANQKIHRLNQKAEQQNVSNENDPQQQQQQPLNRQLEKRCKDLEEELGQSSKLLEDLSKEYKSLEQKLEHHHCESAAKEQKAKEENLLLVNRLARIHEELQASRDTESVSSSEAQKAKDENLFLTNRLAQVNEELNDAKKGWDSAKKAESEILERCQRAESDLQLSEKRCSDVESELEEHKEALKKMEESMLQTESDLQLSEKRCSDVESELEERKEELKKMEESMVQTTASIPLDLERVEKSPIVEDIPQVKPSDQRQKELEEENNRLKVQCNDLEVDIVFKKDESEQLASSLRNEVSRVEAELLLSKDQCTKLESELDEMKKAEADEKTMLLTRLAELEKGIEESAKESEEAKAKFEKERAELNEKLQKEQQLASVMAQEHELSVIGLKKEFEAAFAENQRERENFISELEKELEDAKEMGTRQKELLMAVDNIPEALAPESPVPAEELEAMQNAMETDSVDSEKLLLESSELEALPSFPQSPISKRRGVDVSKDDSFESDAAGNGDIAEEMGKTFDMVAGVISEMLSESEEHENDVAHIDKDANEGERVSERVHAIEKGSLTSRIEELTKELEITEEKWKTEKERVEKELLERLQKEENLVKELEKRVEKGNHDLEKIEKTIQETAATKQNEEALSSRITELEQEKRAIEKELKSVTEANEKEMNEAHILRANILELEKDIEGLRTVAIEQNQLSSRVAELEEEKRVKEQEMKEKLAAMKVHGINEMNILQARIAELEKELDDTKKDAAELAQLKSRVTELEEEGRLAAIELKEVTEAKEKDSSETKILQTRVSELETDLENSKKDVEDQNQLQKIIVKLKAEIEDANGENENLSSKLKCMEAAQEEKNNEHKIAIARCSELENELDNTKKAESDRQALLVQQVSDLEHKLELSSKNSTDVSHDKKSFEAILKTEKDLHDKVKEEHQDILEKCSQIENEVKEFQLTSDKNAADAGQRIVTLVKWIDEATHEKDEIASKCVELERNLKQAIEKNAELSAQIKILTASSRGEKDDKKRVENRVIELEQRLKSAIDGAHEEQDTSLSDDESDAGETDPMKRIAKLKTKLAVATEYNDNLCSTIETYIDEKDELRHRKDILEKEIELMQESNTTEQQALIENIDRLEKELESILKKNSEVIVLEQKLKSVVEGAQEEQDQLKNHRRDISLSDVDSDEDETDPMKRIAKLKMKLAEATEYNDNLCLTIETYIDEKDELRDQKIRLEKDVQSLNESIDRSEKELESTLNKNRKEKHEFNERISSLEKAMATSEELNKKLTSEVESRGEEVKDLQLALENSKAELDVFAKQMSTLESELESINDRNKGVVSKNESVDKEVKELLLKLEQNKEENECLLDQVSFLETALVASASKNKELCSKIEFFEKERTDLESNVRDNDTERQELIDRVAALKRDSESISAENDALSSKLISLNEVKEENGRLSSRVSNLEDALKSSSEKNLHLSERVESLKNLEVDHQQNCLRITELENELQSSEERNSQLSADIEILKAEEHDAAKLKRDIADIESELESLNVKNQDLSTTIESLKANEEENQHLKDQLAGLEAELDSYKATNRDLTARIDSSKEDDKELKHVANQLPEESELDSFEGADESLETDNKSFQEQEEELIRRITNLETELKSFQEQEEELIRRISNLETELESSRVTNEALVAEAESLEIQKSEQMSRITDLVAQFESSQETNVSLTADLESLREQQAEGINRMSELEEERTRAKDEEIAGFAEQISNLESKLDLTTQENHRLSEDRKSFDSTYNSINDDLNRAKEENNSLQARCKVHDSEMQEFRNEIDMMKVKAEEEKNSLVQKNEVNQKEKEELKVRCTELENLVKQSTEENKEITSLLREKSSRIEALNEKIDEIEDLKQRAFEYDIIANQCKELEEELVRTIEFNEGLTGEMNSLKDENNDLKSAIFDSEVDLKNQGEELRNAQKSNRGLEKRCAVLKNELDDLKDQYKNLADKIAYPDEVEDGHEWTRLQLAELENKMDDVKKENELLENRMEDVMEENELLLLRLQEYKDTLKQQQNLEKSHDDQNLVSVCKELEEELLATAETNDNLKDQIAAFEKQIEDWKQYAENIETELEEESEALQESENKNADLLTAMTILDKELQAANKKNEEMASQEDQNKGALAHMLEAQGNENKRLTDQCWKLEGVLKVVKKERDEAKNDVNALITAKKDLQNMLEEAVQDIHELEESTEKLNAVILAKNEMKRLLDKAELGRDELNAKYSQCKRDLDAAKEHLHEANLEKEVLNRQLDIEKQVSLAYKSEDENEFDELYRKAREELNDMEMMLEESRACVTDLEENVEILQHQLQAALTFKLQPPKPKPRPNRKLFGWRGGNRNAPTKESPPAVVSDEDLDEELVDDAYEEEQM